MLMVAADKDEKGRSSKQSIDVSDIKDLKSPQPDPPDEPAEVKPLGKNKRYSIFLTQLGSNLSWE